MPPSVTKTTDSGAALVFYFFNQLSRYPRPSRKEDAAREFVVRWARDHSYRTHIDKTGNCIVTVPADPARQNRPPLALQAHLDMVCESVPGHRHDFSSDPIIPRYDGDWVRADYTTLGADNGIGVALALALGADPLIVHPELELIFTVDEETGLTGAAGLSADAIKAKHLLNLDSEDDAVLINGCAGGASISVRKAYQLASRKSLPAAAISCRLCVSGFLGGHSGVDIHKPLGNALCCGAQILSALLASLPDRCYLGAIKGGTVHNAIPRECEVKLLFADADARRLAERIVTDALKKYVTAHSMPGGDTTVEILPCEERLSVRTAESSAALVAFLTQLPHGVDSLTANPEIPQTSSNVARISHTDGYDYALLSVRSSRREELMQVMDRIAALATAHDAEHERSGDYPAWHPQPRSVLLRKCAQAYHHVCGSAPRVEVIHAGLETAVISRIAPQLDMLSCGPLILNPHSPQERVSIKSTATIYRMLIQLLRDW